jgi:hypothetical protein
VPEPQLHYLWRLESASSPFVEPALEAARVKTSSGKSAWPPMQVKRALTRAALRRTLDRSEAKTQRMDV